MDRMEGFCFRIVVGIGIISSSSSSGGGEGRDGVGTRKGNALESILVLNQNMIYRAIRRIIMNKNIWNARSA
jgi:hypothetical protein